MCIPKSLFSFLHTRKKRIEEEEEDIIWQTRLDYEPVESCDISAEEEILIKVNEENVERKKAPGTKFSSDSLH